jgi:hypothetical protein
MRDEELTPLRASLQAYDRAVRQSEECRGSVAALGTALGPSTSDAATELEPLHDQLAEAVRLAELASAMARGALGVVVAMRGLGSRPAPARIPYTPPEGEDYIGT